MEDELITFWRQKHDELTAENARLRHLLDKACRLAIGIGGAIAILQDSQREFAKMINELYVEKK